MPTKELHRHPDQSGSTTATGEGVAHTAGAVAWLLLKDWHERYGLVPNMDSLSCISLARSIEAKWKGIPGGASERREAVSLQVLNHFGFFISKGSLHRVVG